MGVLVGIMGMTLMIGVVGEWEDVEDPRPTVVWETLIEVLNLDADSFEGLNVEDLFVNCVSNMENFVDGSEYGDVSNGVKAIEMILWGPLPNWRTGGVGVIELFFHGRAGSVGVAVNKIDDAGI